MRTYQDERKSIFSENSTSYQNNSLGSTRQPRHLISRIFDVHYHQTGNYFGYLSNLSTEGAAVVSVSPMKKQNKVYLRVDCEDEDLELTDIYFEAICQWSKDNRNDGLYESGFRFQNINYATTMEIRKLVKYFSSETY
ncbi:MAG: PilZ domain-containing protein [Deltaproteobacteria bacterium]|nr:PilZ domain-containing protein [Deltaproteobacteria bacterium]